MPPEDRLIPRFVAEPPQSEQPSGAWAQRLREEFLAACLGIDADGEPVGEPGKLTWHPDRTWHGRTFVPVTAHTSADSVASALSSVEAELGVIDVLVNNAGVADSRYCLKVDEESWDYVMETNLKGAWRMARAVAARCVEQQVPGSIVNVASILGLRVAFGESTYATSKAGLVQLTRSMALELGNKGVRVNAICPGYFRTEMNQDYFDSDKGKAFLADTPAQRLGRLEELDAPLLMLASNAGSFINGVSIPVDGGHMVKSL